MVWALGFKIQMPFLTASRALLFLKILTSVCNGRRALLDVEIILEKAGPRVCVFHRRAATWKSLQVCLDVGEKECLCIWVSVCLTIILLKREEKILCSNFSSSVLQPFDLNSSEIFFLFKHKDFKEYLRFFQQDFFYI